MCNSICTRHFSCWTHIISIREHNVRKTERKKPVKSQVFLSQTCLNKYTFHCPVRLSRHLSHTYWYMCSNALRTMYSNTSLSVEINNETAWYFEFCVFLYYVYVIKICEILDKSRLCHVGWKALNFSSSIFYDMVIIFKWMHSSMYYTTVIRVS